ncbi:29643_t:CDS:2, partial [Gigaspora margarita]
QGLFRNNERDSKDDSEDDSEDNSDNREFSFLFLGLEYSISLDLS